MFTNCYNFYNIVFIINYLIKLSVSLVKQAKIHGKC